MNRLLLFGVFFIAASCSTIPNHSNVKEQYFLTEVKPVLQQNCLRCHNGTMPSPALNLTSKDDAFKRNSRGQNYILPGRPDQSLLVTAVQRSGAHLKLMPRTDISLTDDQIGMLREWIEDGAFWPTDKNGILKPQSNPENP